MTLLPDVGAWLGFIPLHIQLSIFLVFQICHMDGSKRLMRTDSCSSLSKCLCRNMARLALKRNFQL